LRGNSTKIKSAQLCHAVAAERLAAQSLASFQGAALLAYNDAVFSEADFQSISSIGQSVKREQQGKTGRFGVGFNASYHISDVVSFISGV